jgi:uncharacterized protein GlcG (DUF336 family)
MSKTLPGLALAAAILLPAAPALAQDGLGSFRSPTMAYAARLAAEAVKSCQGSGYRVVAVVVDRAGQVLALLRDENARGHAIEIATRKAYTSAMVGYDTARLATNIANGTTPASITQTSGFTGLIGGLPIKLGDEVVGAIGVSGAPGGPLDEACAKAAMQAVPLTN